jgi:hypothetical protein
VFPCVLRPVQEDGSAEMIAVHSTMPGMPRENDITGRARYRRGLENVRAMTEGRRRW